LRVAAGGVDFSSSPVLVVVLHVGVDDVGIGLVADKVSVVWL
jgi:hypothetical protein